MKIFVYRPGAIGDTILTLPALAALRARFPNCELAYAGNGAMLPLLPVEHALSADDARLLPLFNEPAQAWPEADLHVIFARQPSGLVGIQRDPLDAIPRQAHMADWLVDAIDPAAKDRTPRLTLPPDNGASLVIHLGAGSPKKRWSVDRFSALAKALDMPLTVVSGPADAGLDISQDHDRWDNLALPRLARKLAGSRLFVGNDSGICHLAAAVGVPTLAIYVSTDPAIWGIRGANTRTLSGDPDVSTAITACEGLLGNSS